MKKLAVLIILYLIPVFASAQNFEKYADMKGVQSMMMTSEMFKLLTDIDMDNQDPDVKRYLKLIENLDEIKVFSTENSQIGAKMETDVQQFLSNSPLKELMRVNNDGKNVRFYSTPGSKKGMVSRLFMFLDEKKGSKPMTVIMSIKGDIDLNEVSKLAQDLNVPGADELKKLDKNQ